MIDKNDPFVIINCSENHTNHSFDWKNINYNSYKVNNQIKTIIHQIYDGYCYEFTCEQASTLTKVEINENITLIYHPVNKIIEGPSGTANKYFCPDFNDENALMVPYQNDNAILTPSKKEAIVFARDFIYKKKGQLDTMLRQYLKLEAEASKENS